MGTFYGYGRVSTEEQSDYSIERQRDFLQNQANRLALPFIFFSEKQSGKNIDNRTELRKILSIVESGDVLGVLDISRLGRDLVTNIKIQEELLTKNVQLQVNGAIVDLDDPQHELSVNMQSVIGQYSRKYQNKRSRDGMDQKKRNGDWIFTSRLLGYRVYFEKGKPIVEIVEEEAEIIRYIFEQYAIGESINKITETLNSRGYRTREGKRFNSATIRRYILKPIYKGYYKVESSGKNKGQEKTRIEDAELVKSNNYEPIVSPELWDSVYKSYKGVKRKHARQYEYRFSYYELGGILKCGHCEDVGKVTSYCHNYSKHYKYNIVNENYVNRVHTAGCTQNFHTFRAEVLERLFHAFYFLNFVNATDFLEQWRRKEQELEECITDINIDKERIEKQLKIIRSKKANIIKAIEDGLSSKEIHERHKELEDEELKLLDEQDTLMKEINVEHAQHEMMIEAFREDSLLKFIHSAPSERRRIYKEVLNDARVKDGKIIIDMVTGKRFETSLIPNRGRIIQTKFDVDVYFNDDFLYQVQVTTPYKKLRLDQVDENFERTVNTPALKLLAVNTERKLEGKFDSEMIFKHREHEIEALVNKIQRLIDGDSDIPITF